MSTLVYQLASSKIEAQSSHFSNVLTSYLAMTSVQYLVNEDVLGINVVLSRMHSEKMLDFASIYDVNDNLIAQVGKRNADAEIVSQQITFQDSTAGYIQVGYNAPPAQELGGSIVATVIIIHIILGAFAIAAIWLTGDLLTFWVFASATDPEPEEETDHIEVEPERLNSEGALLVLKLEPSRLTSKHRELMISALNVYGGKTTSEDQDLIAQFRQDDSAFSAVCAGLLLHALVQSLGPPLKIKLGIHWSEQLGEEEDEQNIKHTSYLASISDQAVLISKGFETILNDLRVIHEPYRSSLAPDGEVFQILSVANQELIERQAEQLLSRS